MTAKPEFDVTSAEPVLFPLGDGPELSANDLARRAWIKGGQKGTPADMTDKAISAIRDDLVAGGTYTVKPKRSAPDE